MTSIHDLTGGSNIKAADLQGRELTLSINGFAIEEVGDDKENKCVAKFADHNKGLVIGAQDNVIALLEHFKTDDIEKWDERVKTQPFRVTLYTVKTNLGPGVRIKAANEQATAQPATPAANPLAGMSPEQIAALPPEVVAKMLGGA